MAERDQLLRKSENRIPGAPGIFLLLAPVAVSTTRHLTLLMKETVGLRLDEGRPSVTPDPVDGPGDGLAYGEHVHAVHFDCRNAERRTATAKPSPAGPFRDRTRHGFEVVFDAEHDRKNVKFGKAHV